MARILLKPQLRAVNRAANTCSSSATAIETKFEDWHLYACELWAACIEKQSATQDDIKVNQLDLDNQRTLLSESEKAVEQTRKMTEYFRKEAEQQSERYKKLAEDRPSG